MSASPSPRANPGTRTDTTRRRLPYTFDAPPKILHDLIRQKVLKGRDQAVLVELLRWRNPYQNSCWATKDIIARNLQCSARTVQRSLRRLEDAGLIRQAVVSPPGHHDPDDPRNRTGWRIFFLWLNPNPSPLGPAPDRRPNDRRRKPIDDRRTETLLSPPHATILSPPGETKMTPKISLEVNQDRNQTTTTRRDAGAQRANNIHACEESSSFAPLPSNPEPRPVSTAAARPAAPIPALEIPAAAHPRVETIELTPTVPARALGLPTEGLDQALLMALVARVVRLSAGFKVGASWTSQQAREAILGLLRSFGCPLWWIVRALDQAERRPCAKLGNKPVESWGFIRQTVSNWSRGDGTPGSPPVSKSGAPPGPPCPADVLSGEGNPSRSPPRPAAGVFGVEIGELSVGELRARIAELEALLSTFPSSSWRMKLVASLRAELSQARSLLAAREVPPGVSSYPGVSPGPIGRRDV
jgi:hypothetical protein